MVAKIARISPEKFIVSAGLNINSQVTASVTAFERRFIRLWRTGFLLNDICDILGISLNHLNDELIRLNSQNVNLAPDSRNNSDYLKMVSLKTFKETIPENIFILKNEDYWFYRSKNISNNKIGILIEVPYHYLQQFKRYARVKELECSKKNKSLNIIQRNKLICNEFNLNRNVLGIKTKLAKKYDLSRRSVDFILNSAGIDNKLTKSKIRFVPEDVKTKQKNIVKDYLSILSDEKEKGITRIGRMSGLASKYNLSSSGIINILKKYNVYKPQKRNNS